MPKDKDDEKGDWSTRTVTVTGYALDDGSDDDCWARLVDSVKGLLKDDEFAKLDAGAEQ